MSAPPSPRHSFEMNRVTDLENAPEEARETAVLCQTKGIVYCLAKGLYRLGSDNIWARIPLVPFIPREGQSMTPTKKGIAFFGGTTQSTGTEKKVYYNDLWLMDGQKWSYIVTPIAPRAYHSACVVSDGNLMIIGGEKGDTIYDDCYIIDVETGTTTRITFQRTLQFTRHTVTWIREQKKHCLLGGTDGSKNANNTEILILDTETKEVTVLENDFRITSLFGHRVTYAYELLFVVGGMMNGEKSKYVWMYSFIHHCWIPLKLPDDFKPLHIFWHSNKKNDSTDSMLHIIDENLAARKDIYVYTSDNNTFNRDNPHYIEFLRENLLYGKDVFSKMGSREAKECLETQSLIKEEVAKISEDLLNSGLLTSDDIEMTNALRSEFDEIQRTMLTVKARPAMKRLPPRKEAEPDYKVAETINALIGFIKSREQTHRDFATYAEKQSKKIELLTFRANIQKKSKVQFDIKSFEHSLLLSEQLAGKIQLCQKECDELRASYESEETKMSNCEARICALHRQLFETYNTTCNLKKSIFEKQKSTFEALSKVNDNREVDLNLGIGPVAENVRRYGLDILRERITTDELKDLIAQKEKLFDDLTAQGHRLKGDVTTVRKVMDTMRNIGKWTQTAYSKCSECLTETVSPLSFNTGTSRKERQGSRSRSSFKETEKREERVIPVFQKFVSEKESSVGKFDVFTSDIMILLQAIDKELRSVQ